jgi:hypothetical protein
LALLQRKVKAMHREGEEVHVTTDEARGAETGTGLRYMLGFGLALVIIAMSAIWITGSLTGDKHTPENATKLDQPLARETPATNPEQTQPD